jgi:hypothetical protein
MTRNWRRAIPAFGLAATFLFAAAGCRTEPPEWVVLSDRPSESEDLLRIVGTIERMELEGGFYAIRAEDGTTYEVMNLPERFQEDGLPVEARAVSRGDMASIRMVGPIVELVRIRERPDGSRS